MTVRVVVDEQAETVEMDISYEVEMSASGVRREDGLTAAQVAEELNERKDGE